MLHSKWKSEYIRPRARARIDDKEKEETSKFIYYLSID
jgi:hypothetical protein